MVHGPSLHVPSLQVRDDNKKTLAKEYKTKVEEELSVLCTAVLSLLDDYLIPHADDSESKVIEECYIYSKTPIYRGIWGKGKPRG